MRLDSTYMYTVCIRNITWTGGVLRWYSRILRCALKKDNEHLNHSLLYTACVALGKFIDFIFSIFKMGTIKYLLYRML